MLTGKKILLVEDEFLIAELASEMIADLGGSVVGPAPNLDEALALVRSSAFDVALLDVNLNGQRCEPVADALMAKGLPFVVATGYGANGWPRNDAPTLGKPYTREELGLGLVRALNGA